MSVWQSLRGSRAAEVLASQIESGEVPHAWLLLGPAGAGKRPAAQAMAAALNCTVEPHKGCGECSVCLRILRRRFPDVHHIVPEGPLIPVDTIREQVIPEAARSPFEGTYKVFIIEEADRMNDPAQNSLLKTLEEPQPETVFILISSREEEVLETIRSRCRVFHLEPVDEQTIVQLLQREGSAADQALLAARVSEGDLERARTLAFEESATERRRLWLDLPRRMVSPVDALDAAAEVIAVAREVTKTLEKQQKLEISELAEAMGEGRGTAGARNALVKRHKRELRRAEEQVLAEALTTLASFYRDVLAVRNGGDEGITNLDVLPDLRRWAASEVEAMGLLRAVERCVEARAALLKNANVPLAIESTFVELVHLVPTQGAVGAGA